MVQVLGWFIGPMSGNQKYFPMIDLILKTKDWARGNRDEIIMACYQLADNLD